MGHGNDQPSRSEQKHKLFAHFEYEKSEYRGKCACNYDENAESTSWIKLLGIYVTNLWCLRAQIG